jgi:hypothetical protein
VTTRQWLLLQLMVLGMVQNHFIMPLSFAKEGGASQAVTLDISKISPEKRLLIDKLLNEMANHCEEQLQTQGMTVPVVGDPVRPKITKTNCLSNMSLELIARQLFSQPNVRGQLTQIAKDDKEIEGSRRQELFKIIPAISEHLSVRYNQLIDERLTNIDSELYKKAHYRAFDDQLTLSDMKKNWPPHYSICAIEGEALSLCNSLTMPIWTDAIQQCIKEERQKLKKLGLKDQYKILSTLQSNYAELMEELRNSAMK